jgi:hypothetical protein
MGRPAGVKNGAGRLHVEPERDGPRVFSLPKLGGTVQFVDLVTDYGGPDRVARDLKIGRDLLDRFLGGELEAPYTVFLALWWHTAHGFRQGFDEAHWTHSYNSFRRREAELRCEHLEAVIQHAAALLERRPGAAQLLAEAVASPLLGSSLRDPLAGVGL